MAASTQYRGLCETCDQNATCTLQRSSRLEIIHCEQYSTQPAVIKQNPISEKIASSEEMQACGRATMIERN